MAGCFGDCNEHSGFIECRELLASEELCHGISSYVACVSETRDVSCLGTAVLICVWPACVYGSRLWNVKCSDARALFVGVVPTTSMSLCAVSSVFMVSGQAVMFVLDSS